MSITKKIKYHYNLYTNQAKNFKKKLGIIGFIKYLRYYRRYNINAFEFFENELYRCKRYNSKFLESNHFVIHKWKNVVNKYVPTAGFLWRLSHRIDFCLSQIIYPGLDAMDYFRYEFYKFKHNKRKTFITEGYLARMNKLFNDEKRNFNEYSILKNKAKFNAFYSEFVRRDWIETFGASREQFELFCKDKQNVIIKPIDGEQGKGIAKISVDSLEKRDEFFLDVCNKNYIIEEVLKQHSVLDALNPTSINSIRVYSVFYKGEIYLTGAVLRIGANNAVTDNYSAGGYAATIDIETGVIISRAVSQNAGSVYVHPDTQQTIIGVTVPKWSQVISTVREAHLKNSKLRYIGWDVVVCSDGRVELIEGNTFAGVALQQHPMLEGKKKLYSKFLR